MPTARWKREKEELRSVIEELKADNQPYQDELAFVKRYRVVQTLLDVTGKWQKQILPGVQKKKREADKVPSISRSSDGRYFEESGKAEQQPVNQQEKKPEKKTSLLRKLDEKKKECAERDAKQQTVRKKRNYDMSL